MDFNFCPECNTHADIPECAIAKISNNVYIEELLENKQLKVQETFVCHKNAQEVCNGRLNIKDTCNQCTLCALACPYIDFKMENHSNDILEKVILNDLGKANILFHSLFPDLQAASEVHVKGNYRNKRIDIVVKDNDRVYFIKLLKKIDKASFYYRSYVEVINQYIVRYPDIHFKVCCLVPASVKEKAVSETVELFNLESLCQMIGGNGNGTIAE